MPIIKPEDKTIPQLKEIHLWHYGLSSCSQRVRIALAEKNLSYTSHIIDLSRGENASLAYQAIHPKGLVPAIAIDGDLIIESVDILSELDQRFLDGSLGSLSRKDEKQIKKISQRANASHASLKLLTFEFLFRHLPPPSKVAREQFQTLHKNQSLRQFHKAFERGFTRIEISEAAQRSHEDFKYLNTALSDGRPYLSGETFTLADIAWMPNFHRFDLIKWPFEKYPYLKNWFERVSARDSYAQGLSDWEDKALLAILKPKVLARETCADGVDQYIHDTSISSLKDASASTASQH